MTSEQTRTPAQRRFAQERMHWPIVMGVEPAYLRAEEVAADVRSLAATVAGQSELITALRDQIGRTISRVTAMEYQRERAEADADDLEQIRTRVLPQSPGSAEAALDPPALDPQIEEIITQAYLYGSARCAQGVEVGAGRDSGEAIKRMLKEWDTLTAMIRAYGGDAREG